MESLWKQTRIHSRNLYLKNLESLTSTKTHTFDLLAHYLRQNHSCQIEGFGDFHVHAVSSQVDPVAQLFHPMRLEPVFKEGSFVTSEDFIKFCAQIWNTESSIAHNRIKTQVVESKQFLANEGSLNIEGLGVFTKTANSGIYFKFDSEHWTSGISFGLPDLRFVPGANKVKTITVDRTAKPGDMEEISVAREQALKELRLMLDQANIAESGKSTKKIGAFPIIATILTLILLINVILFLKKNPTSPIQSEIARMDMASETGKLIKDSVNPLGNNDKTIPVPELKIQKEFNPGAAIKRGFIEFDSNDYFPIVDLNVIPDMNQVHEQLKPESTEESIPVTEEVEPIVEEKPVIKNAAPAPVIGKIKESNSSNASYSLVAGAFKSNSNAKKLEKELKAQGYKNASVLKPKNHIYFLVFYDSFSKREDAMKLQTQLESNGEEPWIFEAE